MALKKIDISGIDSTIAETREDELRQKEIEAQSDLALQIRLFMKETPYIINEIREAASPMTQFLAVSILSAIGLTLALNVAAISVADFWRFSLTADENF